jgi:hypothetical protein
MKNIITLLFTIITTTLNAQLSMMIESGVSSLGSNNHVGFEFISKESKVGFYTTVGGNWMDRMIGINTRNTFDIKGDFTSTVSWYNENGTYYQTLPPSPEFTTTEWGNRLLESGTCINTVEIWDGEITSLTKIYNVGVVIRGGKKNNLKYRVGVGLRNLTQTGYVDYSYWQNTFNVSKFYDEWGVVAQPSGVFVVVGNGSVIEKDETKHITVNKKEVNMNFAVEYGMNDKTALSLGYNTKGGINLGITYNF